MKALLCLLLLTSFGFADDIAIHGIGQGNSPDSLTVIFAFPAPDQAQTADPANWTAFCYSAEHQQPTSLSVSSANYEGGGTYAVDRQMTLHFNGKNVMDCASIQITFLVGKFPSGMWAQPTQAGGAAGAGSGSFLSRHFDPVADSDSPDYSLSFTVAPAVGSSPLYSIDGSINHAIAGLNPSLAFIASAKSDSSKKADPDSFTWALKFLDFPRKRAGLGGGSNFAGMEFDKTGNVMNEVSQAELLWAYRQVGPKRKNQRFPFYSWALNLGAGLEVGDNFKNEFTIANQPGHRGTGLILRGVPRAKFILVFPTSNPKHAVNFTSSYTVRLPARDELFLETRLHTTDPVPLLGTNPRHYVENNLTFNVTSFFAFKVQHSYGSLPPAFSFTDNKGSIGIVFQAKQPR